MPKANSRKFMGRPHTDSSPLTRKLLLQFTGELISGVLPYIFRERLGAADFPPSRGRESLRMSRRHTLLVVDDEPDVVQSVQDLLRLDYQVLGATRAKDGLRILQEREVHLVMTDQRMPEMTGVEFLSQVRGGHPEAIRLLFTGYAD